MKKLFISALATCMVLCLALPVMALDVDFSGQFRTDGVYNDNTLLLNNDTVSDAYLKGRFRLKTVFTVNDNISLTTRFDALEKVWGKSDEPKISSHRTSQYYGTLATFSSMTTTSYNTHENTAVSDDNIDFDWAYATVKTPIGGFLFGRMSGNAWGTQWGDTEGPRDRIVYVLPVNKLVFAGVFEKYAEYDADNSLWSNDVSDSDRDKWYLTATWKEQNFTTGLLYGFYNYKVFQDMYQRSQTMNAQSRAYASYMGTSQYVATSGDPTVDSAMLSSNSTVEGQAHVLSPYFKGKFGGLGILAELNWATAKGDYDSAWYNSTGVNAAGSKEKTLNILSYMGELNYDIGPFTIGGGYAYSSGDADWDDDKIESQGFFEEGSDWDKTIILFSDESDQDRTLGGLGNPLGKDTVTSWYGYKVWFLQADYDFNENFNLAGVFADSKADKVPTGWLSDSHGSEFDLILTMKFLNNLTWYNYAAFLSAGDFYKGTNNATEVGDTYTVFSRVTIDF